MRTWPASGLAASGVRAGVRSAIWEATGLPWKKPLAGDLQIGERGRFRSQHAQPPGGFRFDPRQRLPLGQLELELLVAQLPIVAFGLQALDVVAGRRDPARLQ